MIKISHRGNINGRIPERENTHEYIQDALDVGYDVEIDIWVKDDKLWLGHDAPEIQTSLDWLEGKADRLWIHCKNFEALSFFTKMHCDIYPWNFFWHESDRHTITSNSLIWSFDFADANDVCILVLLSKNEILNWSLKNVAGICSDYVGIL